MKNKYQVTLDYKITVWERASAIIEAESLEEAQEELLSFHRGNALEPGSGVEYESIEETSMALTDEENWILNNKNLFITKEDEFDYSTDPATEFLEEHNYIIENI